MITYEFTDNRSDSLYVSLYKKIKQDIIEGSLKRGERLPSKRTFASNLGVSVVTVENAYAQLLAEGFIYSRPRSGFFVADISELPKGSEEETINEEIITPKSDNKEYFADFTSGRLPSELFPFSIWSRVIREVLNDSRLQLMTSAPCGGILALRKSIANYLREFRDMTVSPEQIIIGAGTEYLYGLLVQLLGEKHYAVENPGYSKPEQIYRRLRVKCTRISMDEAGVSASDLDDSGADVVHISPSHQFPTGIVMPISRRYELLAWAAKKDGRFIIEDDYDSELRLSGKPIPTLQSIDRLGKVIYMNTFTKTLCSTVRISYMILPPNLAKNFYDSLSFYSCTVSNFEQYTLARFIDEGCFEKHVNRLRNYYRKKRDVLLASLKGSSIGRITSVYGAEAGSHFLMKIDTKLPQEKLLSEALLNGIRLSPLSAYYQGEDASENFFVMNYSSVDAARAAQIWSRLAKALRIKA